MTSQKNFLDREAVRSVIQQWNANRLDLFALSEPDENLLFHGVMRFYFQDAGQKVATKCIRVASDATVADVIDTLIEKFRPDMRMLSVPNYALYEVHSNGEERKLNRDEKPLLVQLNWHIDDREGRFLLKNIDQKTTPIENTDTYFKRKLSKREKKDQKKKEKLSRQNWESQRNTENETHVADKLYTELPDTSFTRSISNPEAVMRRRRQQKLEKKLQQFRSKDGGPDTGGTLKIYGESLCQDVPYKTLLLSIRDCAQAVVREMLSKYGLDKTDPLHYCLVQVNCDGTEYILDDDECPLSILMNHPTSRGSIMFHVRRRPADAQPRRRKKKPLGTSNGSNSTSSGREGPILVEVTHSGDSGRRIKLGCDPIEVGSANTNSLQLFGPSIQARHCLISLLEGVCTVTPLHADALTFVNGHHVTQPTILHNGSVVMIGRVASYRFIDSPSDGRFNLALSQSQLDSACLYESRSPALQALWSKEDGNISTSQTEEVERGTNNNHTNVELGDEYKKQISNRSTLKQLNTHSKEIEHNYEATEQNLDSETKSISSLKSAESHNQDQRSQNNVSGLPNHGQEFILPAVLEFPEKHQEQFLSQIITELDVNLPHFKLAPVYSLYLCARYRASTHYRPELQPTERAHKLTIFLHHVANLMYSIIQEQYANSRALAFWMANSSEFLNFLKSDRHISAFSVQAQEILAESVQTAFHNLVNCFRVELAQTLNQFLSETTDHESAAGLVLTILGSAMALLRRCRVNAALTIQLFSQLFHYINAMLFNTIIAKSHMCTAEWGKVLTERLQLLELWAERQGLELAADCHLAKINQCAQFLQSPKTSVEEIQKLSCSCFRLNSLQMAALLQDRIPRNLVDTAIRMAESVADELTRADGREVRLEESAELHLVLLLPDDGFSCDVVRGIPSGLLDFLSPLQSAGICRLAAQPTSIGLWTVYMHQFNARSPSQMSNKLPQPEVQVIKLQKNSNGMGLSIVAAKGAGQDQLGIYIKSVVPGGAADGDNRLQAGDQLLRVDGQSLVGITQERAAGYLVRTGPVVTLEVAKQGAIYHGLATLLQQPSPITEREDSEDVKHHSYCNSDSEESLNNSNFETQNLRLSASSFQDELCEKGYKLHIDPRYRDTRPIARSSSNFILPMVSNTHLCNREPNPSIYIEEYCDEPYLEGSINSYSDAHQPLNEEGIASVAKTDEIPFIDDNFFSEDVHIYKPEMAFSSKLTNNSDKTKVARAEKDGIIRSNRRRSVGYRKTVSFDLVAEEFATNSQSVPLDQKNKRKSLTNEAINNYQNLFCVEHIKAPSFENVLLHDNENYNPSQAYLNHQLIVKPIFDRKNKRELNTDRSTSGKKLNRDNTLRRASSAICPSAATIEVPLNVKTCSSEENYLPHRRHSHTSIFTSPSRTEDDASNDEENAFFWQSRIHDNNRSKKDVAMIEGDFRNNEQLSSNLSTSKSVPILHHTNKNIFNLNSNSRIAQSLSNSNEQGFYQNLSAYRVQNQHALGERPAADSTSQNALTGTYFKSIQQLTLPNTQQGLTNQNNFENRPASAYYQGSTYANYIENTNNTPTLLSNHMYISSDNLGKSAGSLNININGNSTANQSNTQQNHQHPQTFLNIENRSKSTQNFNKEELSQNSLRMNQMLAPSMPNISDTRTTSLSPHISNTGLLSSQSMQNMALINQATNQVDSQQPQLQQQRLQNSFQSQQLIPKNSGCFQPSLGEKSIRRNHRTESIQDVSNHMITHSNSQQHVQQQEQFCANVSMALPKPHEHKYSMTSFPITSPKQHPPNIPNSQPIRALQNFQKQPNIEETPPLPPTTTHPLFKGSCQPSQGVNCVVNSSEPQRGSFYPINTSLTHQGHFSAANPWEREEREKEQELRREHIRIWRDKQITNLSNLPHRFPQQEEQLKALVLEREFERRAHEAEDQEEDSEPSLNKEKDEEEKFRKQQSSIQPSNTNICEGDIEVKQVIGCLENREMNNKVKVSKTDSQVPLLQNQPSTTLQPKGILKNNRYDFSTATTSTLPSKTNKNTSDERDSYGENAMNNLSKNISNLNLDIDPNSLDHLVSGKHVSQSSSALPKMSPPSPPERNISYIVMSQKQNSTNNSNSSKHVFPSQVEAYNQYNNNIFSKSLPSHSLSDTQPFLNSNAQTNLLILGRDTKRVSFHDKENNCESMDEPLSVNESSQSSNKMDICSPSDLASASNEILQSPHSPEADLWNLTVKSTPGVIGSQEVYRDPRQRRLAEQHEKEQQRSGDGVPEKLSFKEKMKMFALESGEDQTPKDKLKISRAQRDIDASH